MRKLGELFESASMAIKKVKPSTDEIAAQRTRTAAFPYGHLTSPFSKLKDVENKEDWRAIKKSSVLRFFLNFLSISAEKNLSLVEEYEQVLVSSSFNVIFANMGDCIEVLAKVVEGNEISNPFTQTRGDVVECFVGAAASQVKWCLRKDNAAT